MTFSYRNVKGIVVNLLKETYYRGQQVYRPQKIFPRCPCCRQYKQALADYKLSFVVVNKPTTPLDFHKKVVPPLSLVVVKKERQCGQLRTIKKELFFCCFKLSSIPPINKRVVVHMTHNSTEGAPVWAHPHSYFKYTWSCAADATCRDALPYGCGCRPFGTGGSLRRAGRPSCHHRRERQEHRPWAASAGTAPGRHWRQERLRPQERERRPAREHRRQPASGRQERRSRHRCC